MVRRRHWIFLGSAIALLLVGVLVAVLLRPGSEPAAGPSGTGQAKATSEFQISYAGAAARLGEPGDTETQDQIRDWARFGLAARLGLNVAQVRDALYDTLPVRDASFADLARQPTGPGRALPDGNGTLHLLVQRGDPHENRTIGLLLDQYRTDSGADPGQVRVHRYEIRQAGQTIQLSSDDPTPTGPLRAALGYVTMRVDDSQALTDFLGRTRYLSTVDLKGQEIWASGWNWPAGAGASVDFEDVSVLQRGYLPSQSGPRPGFSLDPGPKETKEDIRAALPGLGSDLADRIHDGDWGGSGFRSAADLSDIVQKVLIFNDPVPAGLPTDRAQLWGLSQLLRNQGAYAQARYDGGLAGTKVGATLFYTDFVTKDWVKGVGSGVPTKAVGGFVPDPDAANPWSYCRDSTDLSGESGRLWFGQSPSAFAFTPGRVSIGAQATRLFARSDGKEGKEVEQSLGFGRGLRWWDNHYQDVADYEPQYQRLDQLMRWSGALDWLTAKTPARLPQLPDGQIKSDLRFPEWYAEHNELRERAPITFVSPPSAKTEALLTEPSKPTLSCGLQTISGGVSLADLQARGGIEKYQAPLPSTINRAGPVEPASTFDTATQTGHIKSVTPGSDGKFEPHVERTISPTADGGTRIQEIAPGKQEISHGTLTEQRSDGSPRRIDTVLKASQEQYSHSLALQGKSVGELAAYQRGDVVTVQWRRGLVDRAQTFLESLQAKLTAQPGAQRDAPGALVRLDQPGREPLYRLGEPGEPWLSVDDAKAPGDTLALRLGSPDPNSGQARFLVGNLVPRPELPVGQWVSFRPGNGEHSATVTYADPPPANAVKLRITGPDGKTSGTVHVVDGHVIALANDPVVGIDAPVSAMAFLQRYPEVAKAIEEAKQAGDSLYRPFALDGDGVALAGKDEVRLLPADHRWARDVVSRLGPVASQWHPLVQLHADKAYLVGKNELADVPGSPSRSEDFASLMKSVGPDTQVYLSDDFRSILGQQDGTIIANAVPRDLKVTVQTTVLAPGVPAQSWAARPEIRADFGAQWWRLDLSSPAGTTSPGSGNPPTRPGIAVRPQPGTPTSPSTTTTTTSATTSDPQAPGAVILLVCPDTAEHRAGCDR